MGILNFIRKGSKYKEKRIIDGREITFIVDNKLSKKINQNVITVCQSILNENPFPLIPKLEIILQSKTDLSVRALTFLMNLSPTLESVAYVNQDEVNLKPIPIIHIHIDALMSFLVHNQKTLTSDYLEMLENFNISEADKKIFHEKLTHAMEHEAWHIFHIKESTFFGIRRKSTKRLNKLLKEYAIINNDEERIFLKIVNDMRKDEDEERAISNEKDFAEKLFRDLRLNLKIFLDLLYTEGFAEYSSNQIKYPFDIPYLKNDYYPKMVKILEDNVLSSINMTLTLVNGFMKRALGLKKFEKIPKSDFKKLHSFIDQINQKSLRRKASVYELGPHMVYVIIFSNDELSLIDLTKMNSFEFVKKYEESCFKLGLKPLISLTSGAGMFDYKRAIGEWAQYSKYFKKI